MTARRKPGAPQINSVVSFGSEPIGEADINALDSLAGGQLSGATVRPFFGGPASPETSSSDLFAPPQAFAGLGGAVKPVIDWEAQDEIQTGFV